MKLENSEVMTKALLYSLTNLFLYVSFILCSQMRNRFF